MHNRRRVLIVEDEPLIALTLQDIIEDMGLEVSGIASSVSDTLANLKAEQPDIVVLDVSLRDGTTYSVAEFLLAKRIPFAFCTGHHAKAIDPRFQSIPTLTKPFDDAAAQSIVRKLLEQY